MSRHGFMAALHERLAPRTYLEVGINDGASLALSRARSIGIDPAFRIDKQIHCDVQLVRLPSDDFFASPNAVQHFEGVPLDLAFIDGMHLAEFALRDFMNIEPLMARTGVVVFDDVLPRNALEAARERRTQFWTGDVFKAVEVLMRERLDLLVVLVNTSPTGTAIVLSIDPDSPRSVEIYEAAREYMLTPDPQIPPDGFMNRSLAVDPERLLALPVWDELRHLRDSPSGEGLVEAWESFKTLRDG